MAGFESAIINRHNWSPIKIKRGREREREREGGGGGGELELGVLAITANLVRFDRNLSKIGQKIASFRVMGTPESR